ncbi:MAG: hypothetical protein NC397_09200 [Clostridium sp.]|nr:hypothetical protein [Clostridium sp.]
MTFALSIMLILEIIIVFSFIMIGLFMFITKDELVHKIFFALGVMLGIFVTLISATALPSNMIPQIIMAWMGLLPAALGIIIAVAKGKPNAIAKLLVLATTVYGIAGYFLLM